MKKYIMVTTTFNNENEAERIINLLLEKNW